MTLNIHLTDKDYIAFNIYQAFHSRQGRRNLMLGKCMFFILALFAILCFVVAGAETGFLIVEIIVLMAFSVIWFFRYPKIAKRSIRKRILKLKDEGRLPYEADAVVEFSETEIIDRSEWSEQRTEYKDVQSVEIDPEGYVYLMKGAVEAIIIPDRYLENRDEFVKMIMERIRMTTGGMREKDNRNHYGCDRNCGHRLQYRS